MIKRFFRTLTTKVQQTTVNGSFVKSSCSIPIEHVTKDGDYLRDEVPTTKLLLHLHSDTLANYLTLAILLLVTESMRWTEIFS